MLTKQEGNFRTNFSKIVARNNIKLLRAKRLDVYVSQSLICDK